MIETQSRPVRQDGRLIPQLGDRVYCAGLGVFGSSAYFHGTVERARNGRLRVRVTESVNQLAGRQPMNTTRALDESWTVQGDPEIDRRRLARLAREAERQEQREREEREAREGAERSYLSALASGEVDATEATAPAGSLVTVHWETGAERHAVAEWYRSGSGESWLCIRDIGSEDAGTTIGKSKATVRLS